MQLSLEWMPWLIYIFLLPLLGIVSGWLLIGNQDIYQILSILRVCILIQRQLVCESHHDIPRKGIVTAHYSKMSVYLVGSCILGSQPACFYI